MKTLILTLIFIFSPCILASQSFDSFIKDIKIEAAQKGIPERIIDELFGKNPQPNAFIMRRYIPRKPITNNGKVRPQKTSAQKFKANQSRYLSKTRLAKAKKRLKELKPLLERIENKYGVDKEAIVALWSIESYFGENQGGHNIPHVLATLAWHPKEHRHAFFRRELFFALKIYQQGHVTKENFKGSWAGAMGQIQFMPSTFLTFAVDGDGDGKKDIWTNYADAFASAAYYLKYLGWQKGQAWKSNLRLIDKISQGVFYKTGLSKQRVFKRNAKGHLIFVKGQPLVRKFSPYRLPLDTFKRRGVPIPQGLNMGKLAYLYLPYGNKKKQQAYLLYQNFHAILSWNLSSYFAFGILSIMDELKVMPLLPN